MATKNPTKSQLIALAKKTGDRQALAALKERRAALRKRSAAIRKAAGMSQAHALVAVPVTPQLLRAAGGTGSIGTLVAEGDSWFDYPRSDVLGKLEDEHGFDVEHVAHMGDRVEAMAYDDGQLEDFSRLLEKVIRQGRIPMAILLSGGGNDIAGEEFQMLLDHARSPRPGLNDRVVAGILEQRILLSYVTIITSITRLCQTLVGRPIRIIVHGYARPVPDGRGFLGGLLWLPGPWLEPGFRLKGFRDRAKTTRIMADLIDRFNAMIAGIPAIQGFGHVRYVDVRPLLSNGPQYRNDWANELHPTQSGFSAVAARFAAAIGAP